MTRQAIPLSKLGRAIYSDPHTSMIRRYPILAFMLVACGYSWSLWFLMMASERHWLPIHFPTNFFGSFGPLIAACVLAKSSGLSPSIGQFLRTTLCSRLNVRWLALALVLPLALTLLAVLVQMLVSGSLPTLEATDRAVYLPLLFLLILVIGGPVGEEFGWRGYVLPLMLQQRTPVFASFLLAALWLIWHLPLFWLEGAAQEGSSIAAFGVTVAAASVLFTWLSVRSGPSLLPVLILHTSINLWSFILPTALPEVDASRAFSIAFVMMFVVAAILVLALDPRMRSVQRSVDALTRSRVTIAG